MKHDVDSLLRIFPTSRRQFLKASAIASGLTAAGAMSPAMVAGIALGRAAAQDGDAGVLNFALTLEHFEARLYRDLSESGIAETDQQQEYFEYYGSQEAAHVDFLTAALEAAGATPAEEQDEYDFPAFDDIQTVLETLVAIEDVGASAYLGAAPLIENGEYLEAAVRIHSTEAYHATGFRFLAYGAEGAFPEFKNPAFADPRTPAEVTTIVADFGVVIGDGKAPDMPPAGAGGTYQRDSNGLPLLGMAGIGAAAAAAAVRFRTRGARETE